MGNNGRSRRRGVLNLAGYAEHEARGMTLDHAQHHTEAPTPEFGSALNSVVLSWSANL